MNVGILGAGTVGAALVKLINDRPDVELNITGALVRELDKPREGVARALLTTDPEQVVADAEVVVELIGGTDLAGDLLLQALASGKRVVTANKAVLAERWPEFEPFMAKGRVYFEAAVMAGTPVIGPLTGALRGSKPLELHAILNGTCNYILSQLEQGIAFDDALAEAQHLGYAEADPTLDIEGFDAAHKLTLLARLAFDPDINWADVRASAKGISALTPDIVLAAMEDGGRVRLAGSIYPQEGRWQVAVRPVYLSALHPLAGAASSRNGMLFRGNAVGEVLIAGAGAGAAPTASAVLADLLAAVAGISGPRSLARAFPVPVDCDIEPLREVA